MEMKKAVISFILALFLVSLGYAYDTPENSDHWEKVHQLNQLGEKFKAETGFTGTIDNDVNRMCLGYMEGRFSDISISADADTSAFRDVFEHILDKILPYTYAKPENLTMGNIGSQWGITRTRYYQQVGGFRVEGAGFIAITYESGRNGFSIGNGTVELPEEDTDPIITPEEAKQIALNSMNSEKYKDAQVLKIVFSNANSNVYYLAYVVCAEDKARPFFGDFIFWIDAVTGQIMRKQREKIIE
jgi:hypothetical protein